MPKWSTRKIAEIADQEGLDYMIMDYLSPENIEDPELAALWRECAELLNKINAMLDAAEEVS